ASYICGEAPGCLYGGPETGGINGAKKMDTNGDRYKYMEDDGSIDVKNSYFVKINDEAWGFNTKDAEIDVTKNVFYTTSDKDCVYLRYDGRNNNTNNEGIDNAKPPCYFMRMSKDDTYSRDYYITPDRGDGGLLSITDKPTRHWMFRSRYTDDSTPGNINWGNQVWHIFNDWSGSKDPMLAREQEYLKVETTENDNNYVRAWYVGEQMRFSALKGDLTINAGSPFEISKDKYISTNGGTESTTGVILPEGETLTINKGGILSISANFINNGTIINNGGVILVKDGGTIYPFLQGKDSTTKGCGTILCNGGDIIIQKGGTVYAGLNDANCKKVPFYLDNSSTLINLGVLVYGTMRLGEGVRVELYSNSQTYAGRFEFETVQGQTGGAILSPGYTDEDVKNAIAENEVFKQIYAGSEKWDDGRLYLKFLTIKFKRPPDMLVYENSKFLWDLGDGTSLNRITGVTTTYIADDVKIKPHIYAQSWAGFYDPNLSKDLKKEKLIL
ncbi:MAG: hypothetical protein IJ129_01500, partial [Ruminococcus sp.]|nr:hypothetical protein [Ruminococcus sp.]